MVSYKRLSSKQLDCKSRGRRGQKVLAGSDHELNSNGLGDVCRKRLALGYSSPRQELMKDNGLGLARDGP